MKKFKNILAIGLAACMLFSMTACNNKDDSGKSSEGISGGAGPNMSEGQTVDSGVLSWDSFLTDVSSMTEGSFSLSLSQEDAPMDMTGHFKGSDFIIDTMKTKGSDGSEKSANNALIASGDRIYFDLGTFTGAQATESGQSMIYSIVRPDKNEDKLAAVKTSGSKFVSDMLVTSASDFIKNDNNAVTIEVNNQTDMRKFISGCMGYITEHESDFQTVMTDAKASIQLESWLDKIVDDCAADIAKISGNKSADEVKDTLKKNIKSSVSVTGFDDLIKSVKESKAEFDAMTDEEYDAKIGKNSSFKITLKKDADSYIIEFDINIQPNKAIETDSSATDAVGQPSDATSDGIDASLPTSSVSTTAGHMKGSITITKQSVDEIKAPENAQSIASLLQMFVGPYDTPTPDVDD